MTSPSLITCGDNVKIWDSKGYSLLHQFQPNNTNDDVVTDVSWSRDGGMVASVISRQAQLVVTGISEHGVHQLTAATDLEKPTCCRFCTSNSRYICVGSHSGSVDLWDNKNAKLVKQYQGHPAPVTRVCFSGTDRHVASASRAGTVLVHNVTSGVVTELPTARTEPQCARDLRYSAVRAALLGAAFDTGHVALWDVNQRRLLHTFTAGHVAPAAGLAFSPVNDILLASVGLDKRLVCYDPKSRSVIQTVACDAPLTSVDFHGDGAQLAVGTSQGRVCVYDLRSLGRPSRAFTAHRSSVQRVQFQPPARARGRSHSAQAAQNGQAVHSSRSHSNDVEETPRVHSASVEEPPRTHSTPLENGRPPPVSVDETVATVTPCGQASADQSSVFSPLRDEGRQRDEPQQSVASTPPAATPNGTAPAVSYGRDSSVFSPVRGDTSLPAPAAGSCGRPTVTPPGRRAQVSPPPPPVGAAGRECGAGGGPEPTGRPSLGRGESSAGAGSAPDGAGGGDGSSTEWLLTLLDEPLELERRRGVLAELAFSGPPPPPAERAKLRTAEPPPPPPPAEPVPHSVVERLEGLQERIDEMWWGMRRENFNTQWSFGKHMYEVKSSMEGMASTIQSLQAEVLRLREENHYLGCKF